MTGQAWDYVWDQLANVGIGLLAGVSAAVVIAVYLLIVSRGYDE